MPNTGRVLINTFMTGVMVVQPSTATMPVIPPTDSAEQTI
jgi:hypothetical protein